MNNEEKIQRYIYRAFWGTAQTDKVTEEKEKICKELVEKYRSLRKEGKDPDEAYLAVIRGIGDVFQMVDEITGQPADAAESGGNNRPAAPFGSRLYIAAPYVIAGLLFLFSIERIFFPLGPRTEGIISILVAGAAAGTGVIFASKWISAWHGRENKRECCVLAGIWGIAAFIFLWALATPRLERIAWLIPVMALGVQQIVFTWIDYNTVREGEGFDE